MLGIERIKDTQAWLRLLFAADAAIGVSVIGWLAQNLSSASLSLIFCAFAVVVGAVTALVMMARLAYRLNRELE